MNTFEISLDSSLSRGILGILGTLLGLSSTLIISNFKKVQKDIKSLESGMQRHLLRLDTTHRNINEDVLKIRKSFLEYKSEVSKQMDIVKRTFSDSKMEIDISLNKFYIQTETLNNKLMKLNEIAKLVEENNGRVILLEEKSDKQRKDIDFNHRLIVTAREALKMKVTGAKKKKG